MPRPFLVAAVIVVSLVVVDQVATGGVFTAKITSGVNEALQY